MHHNLHLHHLLFNLRSSIVCRLCKWPFFDKFEIHGLLSSGLCFLTDLLSQNLSDNFHHIVFHSFSNSQLPQPCLF